MRESKYIDNILLESENIFRQYIVKQCLHCNYFNREYYDNVLSLCQE